ncbi:hypothetical protein [Thiocystis violacea]|uniref:hypothetical protein n=1 Tax=Thiocystis violacea TaxID=13725 RepID=UPI001908E2BE|nr:hypothetical protein [Thiocystis violacea]MBK1720724.1 hypothetical protein [Thiocystis violacea]
MTEIVSSPDALSARAQGTGSAASKLFKIVITLSYIGLYGVAIFLISLTDHDPASAQDSWYLFIPIIGLVSAIGGWRLHAGSTAGSRLYYVIQLLLHWGSLMLVISLLFMADVQHFLRAEDDGFVIIYLAGLTSMLAGIYLDWKMAVFGLFLLLSGVGIAFLDDNALLIALSTGAVMAVIITILIVLKMRGHAKPPSAAGVS